MTYRYRDVFYKSYDYESTLEVDGKPRSIAKDMDDFVHIWRTYHEPGYERPVIELEPLGTPDESVPVPAAVNKIYALILKVEQIYSGVETAIWQEGDRWVMGMNITSDAAALRISMGPGKARLWNDIKSRLIVEGKDYSRQARDLPLGALLSLLGLVSSGNPNGTGPITGGSTSSPGVSNSVMVRRATVIRN